MSIWNQAYEDFRAPYYEEEKKAKKDYDGDGEVESGSKEHAGAVHNAIQRAKGGKPDGKDTRKEEIEVEEGYKEIDKKKENKMYRRAGNLARTALSSKGKKKEDAMNKSGKIVSAISRQKENERFSKMGDEKARSNYKEENEIEEGLKQARKNVGMDPNKPSCWNGYKATGTKMKGGKQVPDCKKEHVDWRAEMGFIDEASCGSEPKKGSKKNKITINPEVKTEETELQEGEQVKEQQVPYAARPRGLDLPFRSVDGLNRGSAPAKFSTIDVEKNKRMKDAGLVKKKEPNKTTQVAHFEPEGEMVEGLADMAAQVTDALPWNRNTKYTTQGKVRKPGENVHGQQTGRGLNTSTSVMTKGGTAKTNRKPNPSLQGGKVVQQNNSYEPEGYVSVEDGIIYLEGNQGPSTPVRIYTFPDGSKRVQPYVGGGGAVPRKGQASKNPTIQMSSYEPEGELIENRRAARDPEGRKSGHSKQPDPSKDGFTGIGNMSIDQIRKMSARIDKEKKSKKEEVEFSGNYEGPLYAPHPDLAKENLQQTVDSLTKKAQGALQSVGVKINKTPRPTARPSATTSNTIRQNKMSNESLLDKVLKTYVSEEDYDRMKDRQMERGTFRPRSKPNVARSGGSQPKGKTVLQKNAEKKYGKGASAMDIVRAEIEKKHGKGAIMDKKKKDN